MGHKNGKVSLRGEEVSESRRKTGKNNVVCVMKAGAETICEKEGDQQEEWSRDREGQGRQIATRHNFRCMHEKGTMKAISFYAKLKVSLKKTKTKLANSQNALQQQVGPLYNRILLNRERTKATHTHRTQEDIKSTVMNRIIPLNGLST